MRLRTLLTGVAVALLQPGLGSWAELPEAGPGLGRRPELWLIPHTHWEGAVYKTREAYLEQGLPNLLTALRLLKQHPEYRFTLDQVACLQPFLERYPEAAGALRQFLAEGRLQIAGGLNVMPDVNLPAGESFVRQVLYGKRWCREQLGVDVKTAWFLDTFGFHAQMPQVLRLAGYDSFWFARGMRPGPNGRTPAEFVWRGLDGTGIAAHWLPLGYAHLHGSPSDRAGFIGFMTNRYHALAPFLAGAARVGLAGGDVSEPELHLPALAAQFNRQTNLPFALRFAVPAEFEAASGPGAGLPVIAGDFNPVFQGSYSSRIELKQQMRDAEQLLAGAESFGALAHWLGAPADDAQLWRAWEPLLFNMAHDLAAGVMTEKVYEETVRSYEFSRRLAQELSAERLESVLAHIDTRGEGVPLVVFNPLGWPRTDLVEAEVGFAEAGVTDFDLTDASGKVMAAQVVEAGRYPDGGFREVKLAFVAREVPAAGHTVYHVVPRREGDAAAKATRLESGGGVLENEFYRAEVDLATGALLRLLVKSGSWQALKGPANVVAREPDDGDLWELYRSVAAAQRVAATRPVGLPTGRGVVLSTQASGRSGTVRRGPVFSEFRVRHPFGANSFATTVRICQGVPRIDFKTQLRNHERYVRYRLLVPTSIQNGTNVQAIPFGAAERPGAQEYPAQHWVDYSDGRRGVALLNRGLPGNNAAEGTLMLSLLRSARLRAHTSGGYEPETSDSGLELGQERTFEYALAPHAGDWREARVYRAGLEFNHPLVVRKAASHPGALPARWGLLEITAPNVVLSALKSGREGALVLRVYEAAGQATRGAELKLRANIKAAGEVTLAEDPLAELQPEQNTLRFDLHPFEIKTFLLRLEPPEKRQPPM